MRAAMKNYQIGMYEKAMPEEYALGDMLQCGKEAGYDFFEISIDRTDKRIERLFDCAAIEEIRQQSEETGLPVGSMCLSALGTYTLGNNDPDNEEKAIRILYKAIDFAEKLGLRIVQIPACDVPKNAEHTKETDERFIRNLRAGVEYATAHSVMLGLENMEDEYMDNVEKSMRLIREIKSPYFLMYPDSGNITSASKKYLTDIRQDMMQSRDYGCAFHMKETRPNKYGGLFYGEGHVDFQEIMRIAWKDLGIRRFVMEYWYTGNPEWKKDLVTARELCEEWINQAEKERKPL